MLDIFLLKAVFYFSGFVSSEKSVDSLNTIL